MSVLHRKLARDLRRLAGQVFTIALVVAAGIAVYVSMQSSYRTLHEARSSYYQRERFAHVFAHAERAPMAVAHRLAAIPGVRSVYPRIVVGGTLPLDTPGQQPLATVVSLPDFGPPALNGVVIASGRWPDRPDEALLLEAFATRWKVVAGDTLPLVLEGVRREVHVVGIANSPEFVFAMPVGSVSPDPSRLAVLWVPLRGLAASVKLDGAFNDVALALQPHASTAAVVAEVERILDPLGGTGANGRDKQMSDYIVSQELAQLRSTAIVVPAMFLFVAGFLIQVVLSRLVALQRPEIATLKALGWPDLAIGLHFLQLVAVVMLIGTVAGLGAGAWLGAASIELYREYFTFPSMKWQLGATEVVISLLVTQSAAVLGALTSVRAVIRLPPAEAMQPPPPPIWRRSWLDRIRVEKVFGQAGQMVWREIRRRPLRLAASTVGIAFAVAILVVGRFNVDAIELLIQRQFQAAYREDLAVTFLRAVPGSDAQALHALPGVSRVEGLRVAGVRASANGHARDVPLYGHEIDGVLRRVVDGEGRGVALPADGAAMTRKLAEVLGVGLGDTVSLELREGDRRTVGVVVAGLVDELLGIQIHMRADALARLLREDPRVSIALLVVDPLDRAEVVRRLRDVPMVADVSAADEVVRRFREEIDKSMGVATAIITGFAVVLAVGIVYNNARVALSQRARDLASLRVLGFTRGEISSVLLGEMAIQVLLGIPAGIWLGRTLAIAIASTVDPERYRLPITLSPQTLSYAVLVTLGAALASALLVRRRLDHLDLIAVLKTRE